MPPSQTSCTIPAEVKQAGGPIMMTQLFAYGPQANFSYPERPANAPRGWQPEWIARVRFRSSTMLMSGMPGMGDSGPRTAAARAAKAAKAPQQTLPKCAAGGIAERARGCASREPFRRPRAGGGSCASSAGCSESILILTHDADQRPARRAAAADLNTPERRGCRGWHIEPGIRRSARSP
jgi:hypothetical protein